jgi:Rad3-related DNA helicase
LASDSDHCTADQCAVQQEGNCFFYRARKKAESAHVIIVNHALLLADVAVDNRVLPEYKYLVVDEAHHLEAQATSALSFEASSASLELMLRGLAHERGGLIGTLAGALQPALKLASMTFSLSRPAREAAEAALLTEALGKFQEKARATAKALGFPGYTLGQIAVRSDGQMPGPPPFSGVQMAMVAEGGQGSPVPVEGGKNLVSVTVSGSVVLGPGK